MRISFPSFFLRKSLLPSRLFSDFILISPHFLSEPQRHRSLILVHLEISLPQLLAESVFFFGEVVNRTSLFYL